ncbi:hypothetical protein BJX66DRAFT_50868 [Aspergillus keveii]|uniref:Secreted protein n=1 Tax=Aspergillus keveii TaxID=714993 RepID=A0ABR4FRA1_9EURO
MMTGRLSFSFLQWLALFFSPQPLPNSSSTPRPFIFSSFPHHFSFVFHLPIPLHLSPHTTTPSVDPFFIHLCDRFLGQCLCTSSIVM